MSVTELVPNVYDVTVRDEGNGRYRVFLFDGDEPTLVDTGFEDTVDEIAAALSSLDVVPERVVLTHGDVDHAGGLAGVVDRYDATVYAPDGVDVDDDLVDERFGDRDPVGPFEARHVPGHAADHYALVAEDRGVAVLGDALFGSDARGLPAGYFVLPTAFFSADLAEADESLERLLEYEFDAGLVFHGSSVLEGADEKIADFVDFVGKP